MSLLWEDNIDFLTCVLLVLTFDALQRKLVNDVVSALTIRELNTRTYKLVHMTDGVWMTPRTICTNLFILSLGVGKAR